MRRLDTAVDATLALDAAYEAHRPAKIIVDAADPTTAEAARAFGQARKVPIEFRNSTAAVTRHAWSSLLVGLSAKLSRLRPFRTVRIAHRTSVVAFVHTAFARPSPGGSQPAQEGYIGPVLEAVARRIPFPELLCVGVGPYRNFRARHWWDPLAPGAGALPWLPIERLAPHRALRGFFDLWKRRQTLAKELTSGDEV